MRYTVDVEGERYEVEVREGAAGLEVRVGDEGEFQPARLSGVPAPLMQLEFGSRRAALRIVPDPYEPHALHVAHPGRLPLEVSALGARTLAAQAGRAASKAAGPSLTRSPMPGVIVEVRVEPGQEVAKGDILLILEAMKMQNEIRAADAGVVSAVHVADGDTVGGGDKLVEFAPAAAAEE